MEFCSSKLYTSPFFSHVIIIDLADGVFLELLYRLLFPHGAPNKAHFMKTFKALSIQLEYKLHFYYRLLMLILMLRLPI